MNNRFMTRPPRVTAPSSPSSRTVDQRAELRCTGLALVLIALLATACMSEANEKDDRNDEPTPVERPASTHSGLVSIHDVSVAGMPQVGHGLSVRIDFNLATRPPDFDEAPGELGGCKAWLYDMQLDPPPPRSGDEGKVVITGTAESIPEGCVYGEAGYFCPVGSWDLTNGRVTPDGGGTARYEVPEATFSDELAAGRYFWVNEPIAGASGRFPIIGVTSSSSLLVQNPSAVERTLPTGSATILAGAGPVPRNPRDPIVGGEAVSLRVEPSEGGHFRFPETRLVAGADFAPDEATLALLQHFPIDAQTPTLSCSGPGGRCGDSGLTALSISSTDADVTGLSPLALPSPTHKQIFVLCGVLGGDGSVTVPSGVTDLIREAHAASPITRLRVAYMQDGFAAVQNAPPAPANPVNVLVGHQVLGMTTVQR